MDRERRNFPPRISQRKASKNSFKVASARWGKELMMEVSPPEKALLGLDRYHK
jgi:hypothetical protein